jgi:hypothetical protein
LLKEMKKCDKKQHKWGRYITETGWTLRFLFWPEAGSESLSFDMLSTGEPWPSVPYILSYVRSSYRTLKGKVIPVQAVEALRVAGG